MSGKRTRHTFRRVGEITAQGWLVLCLIFIPGLAYAFWQGGLLGITQIAIVVGVTGWLATADPKGGGLLHGLVGVVAAWLCTVAPVLLVVRVCRYLRPPRLLPKERAPSKSITFFD